MNIPDNAVNAASEAIYDEFGYAHGLNGTECDRVAEVALRFAAPLIGAQALRDLAGDEGAFYLSTWLRDRASETENK